MTTEQKISVQRSIDASTAEVFDVLSNPERHPALDGSGFVLSVDHADRITATGQSFRMNMTGAHMGGEYQTDNVVSAYDHNKMVGWKTAPAGQEPPGWEWLWELEAHGGGSTQVTLTYDWSHVTDPVLLQKISFPLVSQEQLEATLGHLASAVAG